MLDLEQRGHLGIEGVMHLIVLTLGLQSQRNHTIFYIEVVYIIFLSF